MELIYGDHNSDWSIGWYIYKIDLLYVVNKKDEITTIEVDNIFSSTLLDECIDYIIKNNK